jgi:hypothetical protein
MSVASTLELGSGMILTPEPGPDPKQRAVLAALSQRRFNQLEHKYRVWCQHYEPELTILYQRLQSKLNLKLLRQASRRMIDFNDFCRWVYRNTLSQINSRSGQLERPLFDSSILDRPTESSPSDLIITEGT